MTGTQDSTGAKAEEKPFAVTAPQVTLPKGGGAIRGIGEKFAANPVTGTASFTVPIATSPGRSGFGPQLSLSYDSGSGNGPYGFGWSLSTPKICRKTDRGLPTYHDDIESDTFIPSGSEDLVRQLGPNGEPWTDTTTAPGYTIFRYRPRVEGLFARIERWTRDDGDTHWRSISRDNILTIYGKDADSRIAEHHEDPTRSARVFSWLISETRDDRGNAIVYDYKAEDGVGAPLDAVHQRNRGIPDDKRRTTNRYLKHIRYGNRTSLLDPNTGARPPILTQAQIEGADWMFQLTLDYGEHDAAAPTPDDDDDEWAHRPDAFSTYKSGFEVRTARLCRRFLMFHHFPGEENVGANCLVRSTDLTYTHATENGYAFLQSVTHSGYTRKDGGYLTRSMPPVEYEYSQAVVDDTAHDVDPDSLRHLPIGLDGTTYQLVDLHGEGIPGILTMQAGAWYYQRNISPISDRRVEFAPLQRVGATPNAASSAQFMDLAGDGRLDLVDLDGAVPGFYEHDHGDSWEPFRPFTSRLNRNLHDPNTRFIDLTGDGLADILITEEAATLIWHPSLGEDGFAAAERIQQALDEEDGPRLVFADGTDSIHLADMSGDGLVDLVRIRNGEICYWPNLGYGHFGTKITMDHTPVDGRPSCFDYPDMFDPTRLRLADIDGSGTTDIIYLHHDGVRLYFNQSGNGFGEPRTLKAFPRVGNLSAVIPLDLHGNGTACLAWSSPLPGDAGRQMRYVDLMGGTKPHLLTKVVNNLGAETSISYASSVKHYLQDERDGRPWITRLPFPVHVVERVETFDHIGRTRLNTSYAYHHGHFDEVERDHGFGMVEQWDTEQFGVLTAGGELPPGDNIAAESHIPPIHTKTWFHTGIYLGRDHVSDYFAGLLDTTDQGEYYREPGLTDAEAQDLLLPDTILPAGLTLDEEREACRTLKGSMLRQEVYADDAGPDATADQIQRARTPYTVTEQNFDVRVLQPRGANRHAVFFTHPRETINYHYERNPADPRIQHTLTLEVDDFGNVLKQAAIGYGRRQPDTSLPTDDDRDQQALIHITATENLVTNPITDQAGYYRTPLPAESRTFELRKPEQERSSGGVTKLYRFDDVLNSVKQSGDGNHDIEYQDLAFARAQQAAADDPAENNQYFRRLIEHVRTLYRRDDLSILLPLGELELLGLPGESYKLAFTPGLLSQVFQRPREGQPAEALLPDPAAILVGHADHQGGYLQSQTLKADKRFPESDADDHWWIPSGQAFFSPNPADPPATELTQAGQHFFLPRRYHDPFGQDSFADFDTYDLLMAETRDALGNRVTVDAHDYRVLQPCLVSDPNRNRTEVAFDTLGMTVGTAVMGKPQPAPAQVEGDSLAGFVADLTQTQLDALISEPREPVPAKTESQATPIVHELLGHATTRTIYDLHRFSRTYKDNPTDKSKWQSSFAATIARETHVSDLSDEQHSKLQVSVSYSDGFGREIQKKIQAEPGPLVDGGPVINPRWVGTGWTIFNNKGKPVRQYEPFFSTTHAFEFGVTVGVSPVLFYDPTERVIATLHPNHTYDKVVFDPWRQTTYDLNDTCAPHIPHNGEMAQTGDPRTDPDIGGYVAAYFTTQPAGWQTWYAQRITGGLGQHEKDAATRAAAHADTPTTAHFDALGRPFLTVARNRVVCTGHDLDGKPDSFIHSRVDLDIERNQRAVRDADQQAGDPLGRIVMRYAYDMLGNRIHQLSMEAGARWMLNDVAGKPIRAWDSRGHNFTTSYDALRRQVEQHVRGTFIDADPLKPNSDPRTLNRDIAFDKIEYGEPPLNATPTQETEAQRLNLRTRIYRHSDSAGIATNARLDAGGNPTEAYDFKGNLLRSTRQLATDYTAIADWMSNPQLDTETFEASTRYDALNRPIQSIAPHSSLTRPGHPNKFNVLQPAFNEANLLERVDVWLERAAEPAGPLEPAVDAPSPVGVANIDYDAKGQRTLIDYKTRDATVIRTTYAYDLETFRLTHLYTRRGVDPATAQGVAFTDDCENPNPPPATIAAPKKPPAANGCGLQNLHYTYDPVGNITRIRDDAQQAVYFRNRRVEPSNDYIYDALYRLIQANGREHLGQGGVPIPHSPDDAGRVGLLHPGDGNAMGTYTERYVYDAVGNLLQMQHRSNDPAHASWTREYTYAEASLTEPGKQSNRLSSTQVGKGVAAARVTHLHDAHGSMLRMPHLESGGAGPNMHWDYKDQLRQVDKGGGGAAFYVYDASGQRVRKVWEKAPGLTEERIYLGGFEIFRTHGGRSGSNTATLERETLHVMDNQRRVALVETRTLGNDASPGQLFRYQPSNHLGSVAVELDSQARILSYEEFAPYGSSTYQAIATETPKRYRFSGKERDEETGLNYHGARYYAPWLARWTSCDPTGISDGLNVYAYTRCSPTRYSDPSGTDSFSEETYRTLASSPDSNVRAWAVPDEGRGQSGIPSASLTGLAIVTRRASASQSISARTAATSPTKTHRRQTDDIEPLKAIAQRLQPTLTYPKSVYHLAGVGQMAGGVLEGLGAVASVETGVGPLLLGAHALDTFQTGARTALTGTPQHSGLFYAGSGASFVFSNDQRLASAVGTTFDTAGNIGATAYSFHLTPRSGLSTTNAGAMIGEGSIATRPISVGSELRLTRAITNRMRALGIPDNNIGIPEYGGSSYNPFGDSVGGNIRGRGINIDPGILQPIPGWPEWSTARLSTRVDAVIAHEWLEFGGLDHLGAVNAGPLSPLNISPAARQLLRTMPPP